MSFYHTVHSKLYSSAVNVGSIHFYMLLGSPHQFALSYLPEDTAKRRQLVFKFTQ